MHHILAMRSTYCILGWW